MVHSVVLLDTHPMSQSLRHDRSGVLSLSFGMQDRKYHNNQFCSRRVNQNIFINRSLQIITNSGEIDKQNYQKICSEEINSLKNFLTNRIRLSKGMLKKFKNYCMVKLFRVVMNKKCILKKGLRKITGVEVAVEFIYGLELTGELSEVIKMLMSFDKVFGYKSRPE